MTRFIRHAVQEIINRSPCVNPNPLMSNEREEFKKPGILELLRQILQLDGNPVSQINFGTLDIHKGSLHIAIG